MSLNSPLKTSGIVNLVQKQEHRFVTATGTFFILAASKMDGSQHTRFACAAEPNPSEGKQTWFRRPAHTHCSNNTNFTFNLVLSHKSV